jgi:hypothetical protein
LNKVLFSSKGCFEACLFLQGYSKSDSKNMLWVY